MTKKFLIFSKPYDDKSGGIIALHKLASILNDLGHEAYLLRLFKDQIITRGNIIEPLYRVAKSIIESWLPYKLNPHFNTQVLKNPPKEFGSDWIVIYPEIILDNPLQAENVVRWMLYKPAFHSKHKFFHLRENEYHIDFNDFSRDYVFPNIFKSNLKLNVVHFPHDHYNMNGALPDKERSGTAYCVRKGKMKIIVHDLNDSSLIDDEPHIVVASLFKRVKTFISYDPHTAYSSFAVLCGAESVVIPDENISEEQWYPENMRYGVAYGFKDLPWARKTTHLLLDEIKRQEQTSIDNVRSFAVEVLNHFSVDISKN